MQYSYYLELSLDGQDATMPLIGDEWQDFDAICQHICSYMVQIYPDRNCHIDIIGDEDAVRVEFYDNGQVLEGTFGVYGAPVN